MTDHNGSADIESDRWEFFSWKILSIHAFLEKLRPDLSFVQTICRVSRRAFALHQILATRHVRCLRITVAALLVVKSAIPSRDPIPTKLHESPRARAAALCNFFNLRERERTRIFCVDIMKEKNRHRDFIISGFTTCNNRYAIAEFSMILCDQNNVAPLDVFYVYFCNSQSHALYSTGNFSTRLVQWRKWN